MIHQCLLRNSLSNEKRHLLASPCSASVRIVTADGTTKVSSSLIITELAYHRIIVPERTKLLVISITSINDASDGDHDWCLVLDKPQQT